MDFGTTTLGAQDASAASRASSEGAASVAVLQYSVLGTEAAAFIIRPDCEEPIVERLVCTKLGLFARGAMMPSNSAAAFPVQSRGLCLVGEVLRATYLARHQ